MRERPNILLVTTDQQRFDCVGAAKSVHPVMTPHIDQLAAEGVMFANAYSDCPLCIPSRTTLMTGRTAYRHGIAANGEFRIPETPEDTLPGRLRGIGYQTHATGKMHFTPPRNRNGFERMRLLPEDYVNFLEPTPYRGMYRGHGMGGNEVYPAYCAVPIHYSANHWIVNESIDFLRQRDTEAPFFMWTSFEAPHPPFDPPESYVRLYDSFEIPEPVMSGWALRDDEPEWVKVRRWSHKLNEVPPHVVQLARKHYYAQLTHIDYELGRLFGELKSQGIWDNTVVIYTSDHGEMLGDHGLFHKTCFYEPSAKIPFILKLSTEWKDRYSTGTIDRGPILLADLYPTVMELAGCALAEDTISRDGRSLVDEHRSGHEARWLVGYMNELDGLYMVTDSKWKYLYYVRGGVEQLFHLEADPTELDNLLAQSGVPADSSVGDVLQACRSRLREHVPDLLGGGGPGGFRATVPPPDGKEAARASNPFAWRGPIRYGGHW